MTGRSGRIRRISRIAAVAAVLELASCGGGAKGLNDDALPRWSIAEVARIGSLDDPDQALTQVSDVLFGPDSLLYVAQSVEREVRVYALDGTLRRRIGRDGEGPGEFRSVSAIGFMAETLFVTDNALRRFSMFASGGSIIESFEWMTTAGKPTPPGIEFPSGPEIVLADGSALAQQGYGYRLGMGGHFSIPWLRIRRGSTGQDTVLIQQFEIEPLEILTEQGREFRVSRPISDQALHALMHDGSGVAVVERPVATSADVHVFRVMKVDPEGDTALAREYSYTPIPTPADEIERQVDALVERYGSSSRGGPSREGILRIYSEPGYLPAYLPPVSSVRSGHDGSLWIERERMDPDSTAWQVIGPGGQLEGEIRLKAGAHILAARGELLAVLELDELDVPYVLVYRIDR